MKEDILLFDLDGTIIDSQDGILNAVQHTLSQYGIKESKKNLYCYIGPPILDSLIHFHHFSLKEAQLAVPISRILRTTWNEAKSTFSRCLGYAANLFAKR